MANFIFSEAMPHGGYYVLLSAYTFLFLLQRLLKKVVLCG